MYTIFCWYSGNWNLVFVIWNMFQLDLIYLINWRNCIDISIIFWLCVKKSLLASYNWWLINKIDSKYVNLNTTYPKRWVWSTDAAQVLIGHCSNEYINNSSWLLQNQLLSQLIFYFVRIFEEWNLRLALIWMFILQRVKWNWRSEIYDNSVESTLWILRLAHKCDYDVWWNWCYITQIDVTWSIIIQTSHRIQ